MSVVAAMIVDCIYERGDRHWLGRRPGASQVPIERSITAPLQRHSGRRKSGSRSRVGQRCSVSRGRAFDWAASFLVDRHSGNGPAGRVEALEYDGRA